MDACLGGSNSDLALEIAGTVQGMCAAQMMLHLTCTNMRVSELKETLERAKKLGIRNILALRGDPPKGSENWCVDFFARLRCLFPRSSGLLTL